MESQFFEGRSSRPRRMPTTKPGKTRRPRKECQMLELSTFPELAAYVRGVLLHKGDLDEATPMIERTLFRGGEAVGVEYALLAPRSIRLSAVWSVEESRILFYDAELARFQAVVVQGPPADAIARRPRPEAQIASLWTGK
jgi:hypothetical protein